MQEMEITQVASKDASQIVTDAVPGCYASSQKTCCLAAATKRSTSANAVRTIDSSKGSGSAADFAL